MCIGGGAKGPQKSSASKSDGHDARDDMSQDSRDAHEENRVEGVKSYKRSGELRFGKTNPARKSGAKSLMSLIKDRFS
jgi:hypothetical protein|tara:strand:- start:84 stop:317 length:234 start_codon:yes stop_codon:yes gene_type:complete